MSGNSEPPSPRPPAGNSVVRPEEEAGGRGEPGKDLGAASPPPQSPSPRPAHLCPFEGTRVSPPTPPVLHTVACSTVTAISKEAETQRG